MRDILIDPAGLARLIRAGTRPRILDVRWRLDRPDGLSEYGEGHIPGAVYVDLERELAGPSSAAEGRHPLPPAAQLQAAARRWGINAGDTVVVYDDLSSMSAARAWWVLRDAGIEDVRILDGALRGWIDDGHPLESGVVTPPPGTVVLGSGHLARLDIDDAAALPTVGVLLDVRAGERYRGEVEPIDPRAGHIPGAISAPTTASIGEGGRFLGARALRRHFADVGVTSGAAVGVYCGSGVTASHAFVALTLAGFSPRLYPGSWSQWSNDPARRVATGPEPSGA